MIRFLIDNFIEVVAALFAIYIVCLIVYFGLFFEDNKNIIEPAYVIVTYSGHRYESFEAPEYQNGFLRFVDINKNIVLLSPATRYTIIIKTKDME